VLLLLLHLITLNYKYTIGRTPLDEGSGRRRDLNLYNTHTSQETNIHAAGGTLTHNPSKRAAADPRLIDSSVAGIGVLDFQPTIIRYYECLRRRLCNVVCKIG
jgi:hypothetical protein